MNIGKKNKTPKTYRTYILKGQERTMPERSPASRMLKWQAYLLTPPHFSFQGVHKYMYNKELHSLTHQQINICAEYFFALIYWFLFSTWSHMSAAAIFMPEFVYRIWTVCSCGSYLKAFVLFFFLQNNPNSKEKNNLGWYGTPR